MIIVVLGLLGLILGSFVNALVWRLHEQAELVGKKSEASQKRLEALSISHGRSMCPHCGHELAAKDLVPVFSWLVLRGKCRYCSKPISWQYPAVELTTAALFVVSYIAWPYAFHGIDLFQFILWLLFLVGFMALTVYDLRWFLLPNRLVYPLIGLAVAQVVVIAAGAGAFKLLWQPAVAALIIFGLFWILFQASGGKWIGGGDVKLAIVLGLIVGTPLRAFLVIFLSSLIVLGFASIGRSNQRQELDRELSSQAYYAAETGVNDAVSYIKNNLGTLTQNTSCTNFAGWNSARSVLAQDSSGNPTVSYTCLLVNPNPKTLEKKPLNEEESVVWPLSESDGSAIGNIDILWAPRAASSSSPVCNGAAVGTGNRLPSYSSWSSSCDYGLLRVDLFDGTSSSDPNVLAAHTKSFFIKPTGINSGATNSTESYASAQTGNVVPITCKPTYCDLPMAGLGGTNTYYIRLTMYYHDTTDLIVQTGHGSFKDAEVVVDATGKAQDELRRVQVRLPLTSSSNQTSVPPFALQTAQGVCKQLTVGNAANPLLSDECQ